MHKEGREAGGSAELESQFILRLPEEPAKVIREALRNKHSLKDRFTIKIENDMRRGEVRVDHWSFPAKVLDLPTVIESLKTIDSKSFHKTADICQMLVCKEADDQVSTDEESPQKIKKKHPFKADKKFLMPHGIAPPMKNVQKRRFRKTLKKKNVEAPEIEKEVKRLLKADNDAVCVRWEIVEDDENEVERSTVAMKEKPVEKPNQDVGEYDIFGGAVSDSDEEDVNVVDLGDNSQNSADGSHLTDSNSSMINANNESKLVTEFTSDVFRETKKSPSLIEIEEIFQEFQQSSPSISYSERNSDESTLLQEQIREEEEQDDLEDLLKQTFD